MQSDQPLGDTYEEAVQSRIRLVQSECRRGHAKWAEVKVVPARITFRLSSFDAGPEAFEGEIDGYTYRAIPTVDSQQHLVTFQLEVVL